MDRIMDSAGGCGGRDEAHGHAASGPSGTAGGASWEGQIKSAAVTAPSVAQEIAPIFGQLGRIEPEHHLLTVTGWTPSRRAKALWVSLRLRRYSVRVMADDLALSAKSRQALFASTCITLTLMVAR